MKTKTTRTRQHGVQSVEIGLHVLTAMANSPTSLGLSELAKIAQMPASKVHRYIVSLCRSGMVRQHALSGRYSLSWAAIQMGIGAQSRLPHLASLDPLLQDLHHRSQLPVAAAIWTTQGPAIIRKAEGEYRPIIDTRVGTIQGMTNTSMGRLFSAFMPENVVTPLIDSEFATGRRPLVDGKKLNRRQFDQYLAQIRDDGFSHQENDLILGLQAIAAPVFDSDRRILLSISMLSVTRQVSLAPSSETATILLETVEAFSRHLASSQS